MTAAELKSWRKGLGLTQPQAAEALGISLSMLCNYEKGIDRQTKRPAPIPRTVALAAVMLSHTATMQKGEKK